MTPSETQTDALFKKDLRKCIQYIRLLISNCKVDFFLWLEKIQINLKLKEHEFENLELHCSNYVTLSQVSKHLINFSKLSNSIIQT